MMTTRALVWFSFDKLGGANFMDVAIFDEFVKIISVSSTITIILQGL